MFRSDTGENEPVHTQKTYAPKDGSTVQSHAIYEAPASSPLRIIEMDDGPGFYSIRTRSENHGGIAPLAFNSHKEGAPSYALQFVFVVREDGSLWSDIGETGTDISIPGPDE